MSHLFEPPVSLAGFYGKIPGAGDFVSRRVSQQTIFIWDGWLRHSLFETRAPSNAAASPETTPRPQPNAIWNFVVPTAICGQALIGMIMPSADRVGRQFPFTLFRQLAQPAEHATFLEQAAHFFDDHQPVMSALLERHFNVDQLEQALAHCSAASARLAAPAALPGPSMAFRAAGDIFSVLNDPGQPVLGSRQESHRPAVPWPGLPLAGLMNESTSYWWVNQSCGMPTRAFTHTGGLNQTLFNELFSGTARRAQRPY